MTVFPAARAAVIPPTGIATGKFQGGVITPTPLPLNFKFSKLLK